MPYTVKEQTGFLEVTLTRETSKYEILQIVGDLARRDPQKTLPDLWTVDEDSQVPFEDLIEIAEAIKQQLPPDSTGRKTALVASNEFHEAQLKLYASEASILKLDMQIFRSRDDAVSWIILP